MASLLIIICVEEYKRNNLIKDRQSECFGMICRTRFHGEDCSKWSRRLVLIKSREKVGHILKFLKGRKNIMIMLLRDIEP